jgi:hypothetical protein
METLELELRFERNWKQDMSDKRERSPLASKARDLYFLEELKKSTRNKIGKINMNPFPFQLTDWENEVTRIE